MGINSKRKKKEITTLKKIEMMDFKEKPWNSLMAIDQNQKPS